MWRGGSSLPVVALSNRAPPIIADSRLSISLFGQFQPMIGKRDSGINCSVPECPGDILRLGKFAGHQLRPIDPCMTRQNAKV